MHVVAKRGNVVDSLHNVAGEISGMRSSETHAANPRDLAYCREKIGEGFLARGIEIGIYILPKQLNFGIALLSHAPRFRQHRVRCPAALFAARVRHHAVGAELVAAFDNGDVSAMRIGAGGELGLKGQIGLAIVQTGDARVPCFQLHQHLRQIAIRRRAGDQRNIRRAFENSFTFLLRHAAQYAKLFSLRLKTLVVVETMKDFLLRFVANGAGVVEDQAGFFDRRDLAISLRQQRAHDFF